MSYRLAFAAAVVLFSLPLVALAADAKAESAANSIDPEAEAVLSRSVGAWKSDVFRKDATLPEGRKLASEEVALTQLKGRYIIGREASNTSHVKVMWFLTYDPQSKQYVSTYFNTAGLFGTEWRGTWDKATNTLTSKSSDAPPTWTSESVNRFVTKDSVESRAWMKNDKGVSIFEMSLTKTRQPPETEEKILAKWKADATPNAELSTELKVLDRLAGTWDVTGVYKKAAWTAEDKTIKSKVVREWVLNRTFLQDVSTGEDGGESMSLFGYDPRRKEYRSWWFSSEGHSSKAQGQWDAASSTLTFESKLPEGQVSHGSAHITDNDHHEWKVLIHDADGKVFFDTTWTCVRAK